MHLLRHRAAVRTAASIRRTARTCSRGNPATGLRAVRHRRTTTFKLVAGPDRRCARTTTALRRGTVVAGVVDDGRRRAPRRRHLRVRARRAPTRPRSSCSTRATRRASRCAPTAEGGACVHTSLPAGTTLKDVMPGTRRPDVHGRRPTARSTSACPRGRAACSSRSEVIDWRMRCFAVVVRRDGRACRGGRRRRPRRRARDKLFEDGRTYLGNKEYALACTAFEQSQKADPAIGTAAQHRALLRAVGPRRGGVSRRIRRPSGTRSSSSTSRAKVAHKKLAELEPKVPHLGFDLPRDADPSAMFLFDGKETDRMALAGERRVEPGDARHRGARAGQAAEADARSTLGLGEHKQVTVDVPRPDVVVAASRRARRARPRRLYGGIAAGRGGRRRRSRSARLGRAARALRLQRRDQRRARSSRATRAPRQHERERRAVARERDDVRRRRRRALAAAGVYLVLTSGGDKVESAHVAGCAWRRRSARARSASRSAVAGEGGASRRCSRAGCARSSGSTDAVRSEGRVDRRAERVRRLPAVCVAGASTTRSAARSSRPARTRAAAPRRRADRPVVRVRRRDRRAVRADAHRQFAMTDFFAGGAIGAPGTIDDCGRFVVDDIDATVTDAAIAFASPRRHRVRADRDAVTASRRRRRSSPPTRLRSPPRRGRRAGRPLASGGTADLSTGFLATFTARWRRRGDDRLQRRCLHEPAGRDAVGRLLQRRFGTFDGSAAVTGRRRHGVRRRRRRHVPARRLRTAAKLPQMQQVTGTLLVVVPPTAELREAEVVDDDVHARLLDVELEVEAHSLAGNALTSTLWVDIGTCSGDAEPVSTASP